MSISGNTFDMQQLGFVSLQQRLEPELASANWQQNEKRLVQRIDMTPRLLDYLPLNPDHPGLGFWLHRDHIAADLKRSSLSRTTAWESFVNIPALTCDRRVALAARHFIEVHWCICEFSDVHLPVPFTTYRARC